jgi:hypothetical protein
MSFLPPLDAPPGFNELGISWEGVLSMFKFLTLNSPAAFTSLMMMNPARTHNVIGNSAGRAIEIRAAYVWKDLRDMLTTQTMGRVQAWLVHKFWKTITSSTVPHNVFILASNLEPVYLPAVAHQPLTCSVQLQATISHWFDCICSTTHSIRVGDLA